MSCYILLVFDLFAKLTVALSVSPVLSHFVGSFSRVFWAFRWFLGASWWSFGAFVFLYLGGGGNYFSFRPRVSHLGSALNGRISNKQSIYPIQSTK